MIGVNFMKARINTAGSRKALLCFGASAETRAALEKAALKCGAEAVFTDDFGTPLCCLLGDRGADSVKSDSAEYPIPDAECLLIAGFGREQLDGVLAAIRGEGLRIPLKAVCTPVNRVWSFAHLVSELSAEHEYMTSHGRNGGGK